MLTRFASNKSSLVKIVAVAAATDAREGTKLVSGATDAEYAPSLSASPGDACGVRSALKRTQQVSRASKGRPWSPERGLRTKNRTWACGVRVFADVLQIVVLPVLNSGDSRGGAREAARIKFHIRYY